MRPKAVERELVKVRLRVAALVVIALVMGGCSLFQQERDLPAALPLEDQQALDVCALFPQAELTADVYELMAPRGFLFELGECWWTLPTSSVTAKVATDPLPDSIRYQNSDTGVTEVDGGQIFDAGKGTNQECVSLFAVSDTGYRLRIASGGFTSPAVCELTTGLATLALRTLANGVPTIDWPADSVGLVDLCALMESSGASDALGVEFEPWTASHFSCTGVDNGLVNVRWASHLSTASLDEDVSITVAGRPAVRSAEGCAIAVDVGPNPALAAQVEGSIDVFYVNDERPDTNCDDVIAAIEPVVEAVAH